MDDRVFRYIMKKLLFDLECVLDNYVMNVPDPHDASEMMCVVSYDDLSERLHYYFGQLIDLQHKGGDNDE